MTKPAKEVLYDTEASLRLVDTALRDISGGELGGAPPSAASTPVLVTLDRLHELVGAGYAELQRVMEMLRQSRNVLAGPAVERIHHTHDKLREVSAATELAATDILDGLERAGAMVDELDTLATDDPAGKAATVRTSLRDELFALMGHMQFQDITSQQLAYASSVLVEMETRLAHLLQIFDPAAVSPAGVAPPPAVAWDPEASTRNREERQAVADEVVAGSSPRS